MADYQIERFSKRIRVIDQNSDYTLTIDTAERTHLKPFRRFIFTIPRFDKGKMHVTARDLPDYSLEVQNLEIEPYKQYLEIGSGLGEFMPDLVKQLAPDSPKPIVIDYVDYHLLMGMIDYSKNLSLSKEINKRCEVLIDRASTILNPKKVTLITSPVEHFLLDEENFGIADVIMDHFAASLYSHEKSLNERIKKILKTNGVFIWEQEVKKDHPKYHER
ncbi:hypothetical protein GOV03_04740 [Candidatus Woesearchaeota archaeon]|nr:hypothetical protein [Candidatus Woesearchaeota archaeon]